MTEPLVFRDIVESDGTHEEAIAWCDYVLEKLDSKVNYSPHVYFEEIVLNIEGYIILLAKRNGEAYDRLWYAFGTRPGFGDGVSEKDYYLKYVNRFKHALLDEIWYEGQRDEQPKQPNTATE